MIYALVEVVKNTKNATGRLAKRTVLGSDPIKKTRHVAGFLQIRKGI